MADKDISGMTKVEIEELIEQAEDNDEKRKELFNLSIHNEELELYCQKRFLEELLREIPPPTHVHKMYVNYIIDMMKMAEKQPNRQILDNIFLALESYKNELGLNFD